MVKNDLNGHYVALTIGIILALINIPILSFDLKPTSTIPIVAIFMILIGGLIIQVMRYNSAMMKFKSDLIQSTKNKVCPRCKCDDNPKHAQICSNCGMPFWEKKYRQYPRIPSVKPALIGEGESHAVSSVHPIRVPANSHSNKNIDTLGKSEERIAWVLCILGLLFSFCFGIGIIFGICAIIFGKKSQRLTSNFRGNDPIVIGYVDIIIGSVIFIIFILLS